MAESALGGKGWLPSYPTNFIPPPGQALFIYGLKALLPETDYQHLRTVQAAVSVVTIGLAFVVGWLLRGPSVGVLSAWLVALNYSLSRLVGTLVPETNYVCLVFAATAALLWAFQERRRSLFALAGLLLGMACLFKPVPTLLAPVWAVLVALHAPPRARNALAFVLAFTAAIAPWIVRNRLHYGHLLPISTNGGTLLALANADELDASRPEMTYWDDLYRLAYYRDPAIETRFSGMTDPDGKPEENLKDRAYLRQTLAYMARRPAHFAGNYASKLRNFVLYPPPEPASASFPFREAPGLLGLVLCAGLTGLVLLLVRPGGASGQAVAVTIAYFLAFGALYHLTKDGRMNLPFRTLLAVPAANTLVLVGGAVVNGLRRRPRALGPPTTKAGAA